MTTSEIASLLLQVVIALAAFATLAVYYRQMKIMQSQLTATSHAAWSRG
jgi:uncharacterized protein (DUF486 family)